MDNRSLAFFLIVFLAVFSTNYYFSNKDLESKREWLKELEKKKYEEERELIEYVESRKTTPGKLPILDVYSESKVQTPFAKGLLYNKGLITWSSEPAPKTVYATIENAVVPLYLRHSEPNSSLKFYSITKTSALNLEVKKLPKLGHFDIQLISRNEQTNLLTIDFAEYKNGEFSIPIEAPLNDAIGLVKENDTYYPVIYYKTSNHSFIELSDLNNKDLQINIKPLIFSSDVAESESETFYVLENKFQQLVFSSKGGSLVEINLPIEEESANNYISPIEVDHKLIKDHSLHSYFPGRQALNADGSVHTIDQDLYYPLLRRSLQSSESTDWRALDVSSDFNDKAAINYTVSRHSDKQIIFEAAQPHRTIRKTFTLPDNADDLPYILNLDIEIEGNSRGLWLSTGAPEAELISGSPAPQLKLMLPKNGGEVQSLSLPKADDTLTSSSVLPNWYCNTNGFFGIIITPLENIEPGYRASFIPGSSLPSRLNEIPTIAHRFSINDLPSYNLQVPLKPTSRKQSFRVFAGPFKSAVLNKLDTYYTDSKNGTSPKYIDAQSYHGWFSFISKPISAILMLVLRACHWVTNSWALSIILLTLLLRLALYPLNSWSFKSMKAMQAISPQVQAIQEKHKKNPQKAQMEIVELYRKNGVNPMSGCLPLLLQMPFLIGMFDLLKSSFELRGASFIPGWIDNLTAPDVLFSWSTPIPLIGTELHALPIILAGAMLIQQRMSQSAPKDISQATDQQRQQQAMGTMMSVVFLFMFYNLPSGLNLYWLFSMIFGIVQQKFTTVQIDTSPQKLKKK